jgi:hypothetical protein
LHPQVLEISFVGCGIELHQLDAFFHACTRLEQGFRNHTADLRRDNNLNVRPPAERQGTTRYERGHNAFRAAQQLAQQRGWAFNWQLIEVPDVGHSARRMFGSVQAQEALAGN